MHVFLAHFAALQLKKMLFSKLKSEKYIFYWPISKFRCWAGKKRLASAAKSVKWRESDLILMKDYENKHLLLQSNIHVWFSGSTCAVFRRWTGWVLRRQDSSICCVLAVETEALVGRRWGFSLASGSLTPVTQCYCPEGETSFLSHRWLFFTRLWFRNHKT